MANLTEEKRQHVLALGRLGWSLRRIEEAAGVRRETASHYLKAVGLQGQGRGRPPARPAEPAISPQLSTDSSPATAAGKGTDVAPVSARRSGRAPQVSACEPYRELIVAALGRGRNAMAIWQDLGDRAPSTRASTLQKVSTKWRTTPTARRLGHAAHRVERYDRTDHDRRCGATDAPRRATTQAVPFNTNHERRLRAVPPNSRPGRPVASRGS